MQAPTHALRDTRQISPQAGAWRARLADTAIGNRVPPSRRRTKYRESADEDFDHSVHP